MSPHYCIGTGFGTDWLVPLDERETILLVPVSNVVVPLPAGFDAGQLVGTGVGGPVKVFPVTVMLHPRSDEGAQARVPFRKATGSSLDLLLFPC